MLDEFILEQLDHIEKEYLDLNQKLVDLTEQEKEEQVRMSKYLDADDIGMELFSPRTNSGPIKEKVAEIQKHLEELRILQVETSEKIAKNREKEEKYQQMLNEARMSNMTEERAKKETIAEPEAQVSASNQVEDLKEILARVEKCINLVNHDRTKCKSELKNLRYFLKALIANDSDNHS